MIFTLTPKLGAAIKKFENEKAIVSVWVGESKTTTRVNGEEQKKQVIDSPFTNIEISKEFAQKYSNLAIRLFDNYGNLITEFLSWDQMTLVAFKVPSADLVGHSFKLV